MPHSLRKIAAGVSVVSVLLVAPFALSHGDQPTKSRGNSGTSMRLYYESLCRQATTIEERDLCQQWRMAEAAKRQVAWTARQFWVTAAEIGALILTVFFTGWAALAAGRAARATEKATSVASDTAKTQLRAYVHIDDTAGPNVDGEPPYLFKYYIKNAGQTPAYGVRQWTGFTLGPNPLDRPLPPPETPPKSAITINAGGRFKVEGEIAQYSPEEIRQILKDDVRLYVFGVITYTDIFGTTWDCPFSFLYGGKDALLNRGLIPRDEGNEPCKARA